MKITKRNGNVVLYDDVKVRNSILKANAETLEEPLTADAASYLAGEVFARLCAAEDIISTQDVRSCVYTMLCEKGLPMTAEKYMEFKK